MYFPLSIHPLILILVANLLTTATAAYTPKHSPVRYLSLLLCLATSWLALSTFHQYINTTGWAGRTLAGALFTSSLVNADRLIIRQWSYGHEFLGPSLTSLAERENQSRWEFGSEVSGSTRCSGSEKEVSNVPHFSAQDKKYTPSLPRFLIGHFFTVITMYNLNTFAIDVQLHANQHLLTDAHTPFLTRLGDVSGEDILTRVKVSMAYWVAQYCYLQFFCSIFAVIAVALNPNSLPTWRPLFGSLADASTIRGFWGKFWHQNMQLSVKGPADFISTHILYPLARPLPSALKTLLVRYAKILLAFAVSGAMHVAADTGGAVSMRESGAMGFFCGQAAGIAVEDLAQEIWRRVFSGIEKGEREWGNEKLWVGAGKKLVGCIWVVIWLSYSSPVWVYPVARGMEREDMLLTPSAMGTIFTGLW